MKYKVISLALSLALLSNSSVSILGNTLTTTNLSYGSKIKENGRKIYVKFRDGQNQSTGKGTEADPYNLIKDALKDAKENDTIIIKSGGKGAFLNDPASSGGAPLIIDKNITIKAEGDVKEVLETRMGGIVLGADLKLENIRLQFDNGIRDHIFLNGHRLELINVDLTGLSKNIDIFMGDALNGNKQKVAGYGFDNSIKNAPTGNKSELYIRHNGSKNNQGSTVKPDKYFDTLFLGSQNDSFDKPIEVDIALMGSQNLKIFENVEYSGGEESKISADDWFAGEPPTPKGNKAFNVDNTVNLILENTTLNKNNILDGSVFKEFNVHIKDTNYGLNNLILKDINTLTVTGDNTVGKGKVSLKELGFKNTEQNKKIILENNSELNLSELDNKELTVNNIEIINGNSAYIRLDKNAGKLNILDDITGGKINILVGGFKPGESYNNIPIPSRVYLNTGSKIVDNSKIDVVLNAQQASKGQFVRDSNGDWSIKQKGSIGNNELRNVTFYGNNDSLITVEDLLEGDNILDDAQYNFMINEKPNSYTDGSYTYEIILN